MQTDKCPECGESDDLHALNCLHTTLTPPASQPQAAGAGGDASPLMPTLRHLSETNPLIRSHYDYWRWCEQRGEPTSLHTVLAYLIAALDKDRDRYEALVLRQCASTPLPPAATPAPAVVRHSCETDMLSDCPGCAADVPAPAVGREAVDVARIHAVADDLRKLLDEHLRGKPAARVREAYQALDAATRRHAPRAEAREPVGVTATTVLGVEWCLHLAAINLSLDEAGLRLAIEDARDNLARLRAQPQATPREPETEREIAMILAHFADIPPAWVQQHVAWLRSNATPHGPVDDARAVEAYPLTARIWRRESTQEWVLEISGSINGCAFISRHAEPLTTAPEDVSGLPSLYATRPSAAPEPSAGEVDAVFARAEELRKRAATNEARQAQGAAVDADEFQKAADDMIRTGTGFMRDGKRIDPADVFIATRPDTSADEGGQEASGADR